MKKNSSYESSMLGLSIGWIGIIVLILIHSCTPDKIYQTDQELRIDTVEVIDENGVKSYRLDTLRP